MTVEFSNLKITGIAGAVPKQTFDLTSLGQVFGEKKVRKIIEHTGISRIRLAGEGICSSDLCLAAAESLLTSLDLDRKTIDGIVFVSQTPDYILPATSVILQDRLGFPRNCVAFDITHGCSGYIYGLYQGAMLISSGGCERVLVCAGDTISRLIRPEDRAVRMIFGDGGSATLMEKGDTPMSFCLNSDGSGYKHIIAHHGGFRWRSQSNRDNNSVGHPFLEMAGLDVVNFALREVPPMVEKIILSVGWEKDQVDLFALHQASQYVIEEIGKILQVSRDRIPVALDGLGNTGPASIPLLLSSIYPGAKARNLAKVVLAGFGVGLSWGACTASLANTNVLPPVELEGVT